MMDLWDFFRAFNGIYIMGFWRFFPDVFFLFWGRPNLDDRISSKWGSFFTMTLEEFSSPEVVDGHMSNEQKPWLSRENGGSKTTQLCGECSIHHYKDPY